MAKKKGCNGRLKVAEVRRVNGRETVVLVEDLTVGRALSKEELADQLKALRCAGIHKNGKKYRRKNKKNKRWED